MKAMISGLINIETTLKINSFPIDYYPIDYPFFGINSGVSGVAYNLTKAFMKLGDDVELFSYIGKDEEGERILKRLSNDNISTKNIICDLKETPASVVLYDNSGKRQIYCDLKDIQDQSIEAENKDVIRQIQECDLVVA